MEIAEILVSNKFQLFPFDLNTVPLEVLGFYFRYNNLDDCLHYIFKLSFGSTVCENLEIFSKRPNISQFLHLDCLISKLLPHKVPAFEIWLLIQTTDKHKHKHTLIQYCNIHHRTFFGVFH